MTTLPAYRKKLIEVDLPLDAINKESAREKSIRHGHPSTLHIWWARRPLASCRAVIFASMVDDPSSCHDEFPTEDDRRVERDRLHDLIKRLVIWENSSDDDLLAEARYEIARSVARSHGEPAPPQDNPGGVLRYLSDKALPIYDPFCGGGSIPLEAQRLGMRAVGSDINPVAVMITKALIELPPMFADRPPVNPEADPMGIKVGRGKKAKQVPWRGAVGLANDIRYYGRKLREKAWERVGRYYPKAKLPGGAEATVIAWLWARTVPCPNPACGVAMPLIRTFQLSTKSKHPQWLKPLIDRPGKTISYEVQILSDGVPADGTVNRNGATCLACGHPSPLLYIREQSRAGNIGEQLTAIVAEGIRGRVFLSPTTEHMRAALRAKPEWRPSGRLPKRALGFRVQTYGLTEWHQLFTERQLSVLTTFSSQLLEIKKMLIRDGAVQEYADVVCTYLALAIGRMANSCSSYAVWERSGNKIAGAFSRQALPMVWDFPESNPFCTQTQNWMAQIEWIAKVVQHLPKDVIPGRVHQADAATTIHAETGPVIVTDPPYYDNIGYADLSDYFYVWLRPLLRDIFPELCASILVPKDDEMTAAPRFAKARDRFEGLLNQTLRLIREHCSPEFPSSIFYAYKQQEEERDGRTSTGWDTMLTGLVNAGFQIVGTWPMRTERTGGVKANVNVLASSVVLVCRPRCDDAPTATRRQFLNALEVELPAALDQLTREAHIAPVDLAQAAIGPGMEVYSRYSRVETISGDPVPVREALAAINRVIAEYDERQQGDLDSATRFCLDWLRQSDYNEGRYGQAETLAQAKNVSLEELRDSQGLLTAVGGAVGLLPVDEYGPARRPRLGEMTAWEGACRMAYHLSREDGRGVAGAAEVAVGMGSNVESVERLARILYNHYDRKADSRNSVLFNNLVVEWPNILARMQAPEQGRMI